MKYTFLNRLCLSRVEVSKNISFFCLDCHHCWHLGIGKLQIAHVWINKGKGTSVRDF